MWIWRNQVFTLLFGLDVKLGFSCFLNEGIVLLNSCRFGWFRTDGCVWACACEFVCAARSQLVVICVGGDSISQTGCDVCEKMDPNNNAVKNHYWMVFFFSLFWHFSSCCNQCICIMLINNDDNNTNKTDNHLVN